MHTALDCLGPDHAGSGEGKTENTYPLRQRGRDWRDSVLVEARDGPEPRLDSTTTLGLLKTASGPTSGELVLEHTMCDVAIWRHND
jgi:hypothetical protein